MAATLSATNDAAAGAQFQATVQSFGVDVSHLGQVAQLQLAVAELYVDTPPGSVAAADVASGTFGANIPDTGEYKFPGVLSVLGATLNLSTAGAAFEFTGTTVANVADTASGAITFNANIGRGTGAVGGFVFAVPLTTSTGTTAQTLTNALVVKATSAPLVFANGTDAASAITGSFRFVSGLAMAIVAASPGQMALTRVNGSLASPTIIGTGEIIGTVGFRGCLTATTLAQGASIAATSTEAWVASTASGTKLTFNVTPNTTTGAVLGMTLDQDKSLTVVGKFGCNGSAAQSSAVAGAALNAYGAGANGLDSGANMSALHALVVAMRAALVANGIMSVS